MNANTSKSFKYKMHENFNYNLENHKDNKINSICFNCYKIVLADMCGPKHVLVASAGLTFLGKNRETLYFWFLLRFSVAVQ